ncbi:MAG TPA: hypothetical protein VFH39_02490 [Candidatus Saccharimonadales bacterium]|nr:hypothetical protein [Candidatus Saccharimonadales bacterium]
MSRQATAYEHYDYGSPTYYRETAWALRLGAKLMAAGGIFVGVAFGVDVADGHVTLKNESDIVQIGAMDIVAAAAFEMGNTLQLRKARAAENNLEQ